MNKMEEFANASQNKVLKPNGFKDIQPRKHGLIFRIQTCQNKFNNSEVMLGMPLTISTDFTKKFSSCIFYVFRTSKNTLKNIE